MAQPIEERVEIDAPPVDAQADTTSAKEFLLEHSGEDRAVRSFEPDQRSRFQLLAGMHESISLDGAVRHAFRPRKEQAFDTAAARHARAEKACCEDASVVDDEALPATANDLARRLADGPALAHATTKILLSRESDMGLHDAIEMEALAQALLMKSEDFGEFYAAWSEGRDPAWRGR